MLLIKNAEINAYRGEARVVDVRCRNGLIIEIAKTLRPQTNEQTIDAQGGALLPGLHDHHIHLYALAAAQSSLDYSRLGSETLQQAFHEFSNNNSHTDWIRATQYHESISGELDRWKLDKLISDKPVRVQHRSGILWVLNSLAIEQLDLDNENLIQQDINSLKRGLERDSTGKITGRLYRLDDWLRQRIQQKLGSQALPNLTNISQQLARYGITGITDTSANNDSQSLKLFEKSIKKSELCQRVVLMGSEKLSESTCVETQGMIQRGAFKILLDEFDLPDLDTLISQIRSMHKIKRPVAFHCVTESQLVFALSAIKEAGAINGDRIEHASLCPDSALPLLKETGAAVVTQPGFFLSRGEQYQKELGLNQHSILYRGKYFIDHDIPFALSSDAPYGELNPWLNMQSAIQRENNFGYVFGKQEKLTPEQALRCYLKNPLNLKQERTVSVGEPADLCLLTDPWNKVKPSLETTKPINTIINGLVIKY